MFNYSKDEMLDGDTFEKIATDLNIIYTDTHFLGSVVDRIRNDPGRRYYVLSHNSDACIVNKGTKLNTMSKGRDSDFEWENIPQNLIRLFSCCANIKDDRIVYLPVGLERDRWFPHLKKKEIMIDLARSDVKKVKMLYLNVNPKTNINSRPILYDMFTNNDWCTVEQGKNGSGFFNYAANIKLHKFILCPDGNALESHRTWEALFIGSYPIVERHPYTEEFARHLPVLIVDDWADVTEGYLADKYAEFSNRDWNWRYLTAGYWKEFIRKSIGGI